MHREGAELAFTYQNERPIARRFRRGPRRRARVLPCDVAVEGEIEALFAQLGQHWDGLTFWST